MTWLFVAIGVVLMVPFLRLMVYMFAGLVLGSLAVIAIAAESVWDMVAQR